MKAFVLALLAVLLAASGCAPGAGIEPKKAAPTVGESDITLPEGIRQVEYEYSAEPLGPKVLNYKHIGSGDLFVDLSSADIETLEELSYTDYSKKFGEVENPREAADVAAIVVSEVYETDPQDEAPFQVCFNETADAWIVCGTLPEGYIGGVFLMAIGRQAGEIIMLQHGK